MKKGIITILSVLTLTMSLCGCGNADVETAHTPKVLDEQKIVIKDDFSYNAGQAAHSETVIIDNFD